MTALTPPPASPELVMHSESLKNFLGVQKFYGVDDDVTPMTALTPPPASPELVMRSESFGKGQAVSGGDAGIGITTTVATLTGTPASSPRQVVRSASFRDNYKAEIVNVGNGMEGSIGDS